MKKFILLLSVFAVCCLGAGELRVLTIGNSFSASVNRYLPQLTASVPGCRIILTGAYIGGCSLKRHWEEWQTAEKDVNHRPYVISVIDSDTISSKTTSRGNVNSLIKNNRYDIITIQQNSANSWQLKSFQPYTGNLIAVLKKYQPQAEIIIQQTWNYRCDSPLLKTWKMTNAEMYSKLEKNYAELAKKYGLRIIPCGLAVQIFRSKTPVKFQIPDTEILTEQKNRYPHAFDGEVVGFHRWRFNRKTSKYGLAADTIHLNPHGEFMQCAVWFSFLFERPATEIKYIPAGMSKEQAAFLLKCAQDAVSTFKQPGK